MKRWVKWIIVGVVLIIAVVVVGALRLIFIDGKKSQSKTSGAEIGSSAEADANYLSHGNCKGRGRPKLTNLPMREQDFSLIIPYGMVIDSHVTPIDHQYFSPTVFNSKRNTYPVYAMADSTLVDIGKRDQPEGDYEYRLVFSMSCDLFYYFDLVTELTDEIHEKSKTLGQNIPVKAGEQIGWIGGRTLDFAVWDMDVWLKGLLVPEHYLAEPWKIHTADPLLYSTDELKQKMIAKYIRTAEPIAGKIDFDVDGRLIGSWFVEGSGGFGSLKESNLDNYKTHLSIVPDHIDPSSFVFSIGDYNGEPTQFGIKGNVPNPSTISALSGPVKLELVQQEWIDENSKYWDRLSYARGLKAKNREERVVATALLELTDARKLKLEIFPNKTATQVSNFTANAKQYER